MPSLESIRREVRIIPAPQNKGLTLTVTVTAYDSGMICVGGRHMMNRNGDQGWLAAAGHVIELMKELHLRAAERVAR